MKKDERDFYLWLHDTLKIKDRKKGKRNSQNNPSKFDYIATKIEEVESKIAEFEIGNIIDEDTNKYKAQPISNSHRKHKEQSGEPYTTFDKMRKVGKESDAGFYFDDHYTRQFYKQAQYMKNFEDDYALELEFESFRPIYAYMDNLQLRTYFTWRTKIKNGIVGNVSWSYVQIYVYEIINGIYSTSLEESLNLLLQVWIEYRKFDKTIDRYFTNCIKDFYICNTFDYGYSLVTSRFPIKDISFDSKKEALLDKKYEGMLDYINTLSSYKVTESIFFSTEHGEIVDKSMPYVFRELDKYFDLNNINFTQIIIGKPTDNTWWKPFRNAVYLDKKSIKDKIVEVSRTEKYIMKSGRWSSVTYDGGIKYRKLIGFILKAIESKVRALVQFKYKLKPNIDAAAVDYFTDKNLVSAIRNKEFMDAISRGVELYLVENNIVVLKKVASKIEQKDIIKIIEEENKIEIILDTSKFDEIRKTAELLQDKLVVEEIPVIGNDMIKDKMEYLNSNLDDSKIQEEQSQDVKHEIVETMSTWEQLLQQMNDTEKEVITKIINGKHNMVEINLTAKDSNQLLEVIIESINEKAIELIGDNIINVSDETPYIYEDYVIEIGNVLRKGEKHVN